MTFFSRWMGQLLADKMITIYIIWIFWQTETATETIKNKSAIIWVRFSADIVFAKSSYKFEKVLKVTPRNFLTRLEAQVRGGVPCIQVKTGHLWLHRGKCPMIFQIFSLIMQFIHIINNFTNYSFWVNKIVNFQYLMIFQISWEILRLRRVNWNKRTPFFYLREAGGYGAVYMIRVDFLNHFRHVSFCVIFRTPFPLL